MSRVSQVWNFYRRGRGQWVETDPVDSILCASGTALKVSQRSTQNCRSMKFLPPNKIDKKGVFFFFWLELWPKIDWKLVLVCTCLSFYLQVIHSPVGFSYQNKKKKKILSVSNSFS